MSVTVDPSSSVIRDHPPITILKRTRADLPLSQTKFLKKTARGKVLNCESNERYEVWCNRCHWWTLNITVLRERYVRDDIPCGYESCHLCASFPGFRPVLPKTGFKGHTKYITKEGHWLVVDTNIVLHQVGHISAVKLN